VPRLGRGTERAKATQHQDRSESDRYGSHPHASASLIMEAINKHLLMIVPVAPSIEPMLANAKRGVRRLPARSMIGAAWLGTFSKPRCMSITLLSA
jgi:hypothetical protein